MAEKSTRKTAAPPAGQPGILDSLPRQAAVSCDRDGRLAWVGAGVLAMCRTTSGALLGRQLDELLGPGPDGMLWFGPPEGLRVPVRAYRWPMYQNDFVHVLLDDISAQRAAAEVHTADQRRQTALHTLAAMASFEYEWASGATCWSPESHRLAGVRPGTLSTGLDAVLAVLHPDDRARVTAMWREHLDTGRAARSDCRYTGPDGAEFPVVWAVDVAERDQETGGPVRSVGYLAAVSGGQRAVTVPGPEVGRLADLERRLAADEAVLDGVGKLARLGVLELDLGNGQAFWSPEAAMIFGRDPRDRSTALDFSAVHPDDLQRVMDQFQELLGVVRAGGPTQSGVTEFRVVHPDGSVHWIAATVHATRIPAPNQVVVTLLDITAQRSVEQAVRWSGQRYSELVAATPVGVAIADDNGVLVDVNKALCVLLGRSPESLVGTPALGLAHRTDTGAVQLRGHGPVERTVQCVLRDAAGEPVRCDVRVAGSVQDDGRMFCTMLFSPVDPRGEPGGIDELTGLPNRIAVQRQLAELLAGGRGAGVAVLLCDIDNFKRVNDALGHDIGDELLVALAGRLRDGLVDSCTVARHSGDEFVVLCADLAAAGGVEAIGDRVVELLGGPVELAEFPVQVSVSIGAAIADGTETAVDLLRFADAALYDNKRRGVGALSVAGPALIASTDGRLGLESELRTALATDGLSVHFQPLVDGRRTVVAAEALVRWHHPQRGMLAPEAFLSVAAEGDLMRRLDEWVLRAALAEAARWPSDRPVDVGVNLSALLPGSANFAEIVLDAIAQSGIDPERVILELVETAMVSLPSATREAMDSLAAQGIRFAVDDFGTGYSSLARLKDLPAQIIKVDRRFVAGLGHDPSDTAVVRAIVGMAKAMGRGCVAEGVEKIAQFNTLRAEGVDRFQGWLFYRSMSVPDFRAVLERDSRSVPIG